jgi:hypothetical protein
VATLQSEHDRKVTRQAKIFLAVTCAIFIIVVMPSMIRGRAAGWVLAAEPSANEVVGNVVAGDRAVVHEAASSRFRESISEETLETLMTAWHASTGSVETADLIYRGIHLNTAPVGLLARFDYRVSAQLNSGLVRVLLTRERAEWRLFHLDLLVDPPGTGGKAARG